MAEFQRTPRLVIDDLKVLQVLSHPLRAQLLDHFDAAPQTVKQVAARLGMTANKLYYHVNLLEEHGLLALVETRTVGNLLEKVFQTAAERFEVAADLLSFSSQGGQERAEQFVATSLDATREDLLRSMEARRVRRARGEELRPSQAILTRVVSRLPEEKVQAFRQRLCALIEEFGNADEGGGTPGGTPGAGEGTAEELQTYALSVAYYASFGFPEQEEGEGEEVGDEPMPV